MTPTDPTTQPTNPGTVPSSPSGLLAEPTFEECQAEWLRYNADRAAGRVDFNNVPEGHHLAYYAGHVVDHDEDPNALRRRAATALVIHPERIVVDYPWMW